MRLRLVDSQTIVSDYALGMRDMSTELIAHKNWYGMPLPLPTAAREELTENPIVE
jgi:hypothetical protein